MKSKLKKVFGIISYFPDNDNVFHRQTRKERSRRCSELLFKLEELWPDVDIIIIAQNWQDYSQPEIKNKIIRYDYDKLGILGARKELRNKFLESEYDYLIMLDDDAMITTDNPKEFMNIIDQNPDGIGVLRRGDAPLNMCAISRNVYSQVEMVDVDPEKGEGFEDDLFVALCFNQFPDKAYMFPKGLVMENALHYTGPGACPSTWAKEKQYDWDYMRKYTRVKMQTFSNIYEYTEKDFEPCVDAVIPYVNSSDKLWVKDFTNTTGNYNCYGVRFRSWNTLKYLMRGISEYMPFVKRIILIVARESQVPIWVNRENVKIVYHNDFIPKEFLPTFNSCTIESYLYRIPDISERFIYFNDDMFPVGLMGLSDFFNENIPKLKFNFNINLGSGSIYGNQCRSSMDMIADVLKLERYEPGKIFRPEHTIKPMLKSTLNKVGELCGDKLPKITTNLRRNFNVNQYIYSYYQYFTNNYIEYLHRFMYTEIKDNLSTIKHSILSNDFQVLCINDSDKITNYAKTREELLAIFNEKFPNKCRFEV